MRTGPAVVLTTLKQVYITRHLYFSNQHDDILHRLTNSPSLLNSLANVKTSKDGAATTSSDDAAATVSTPRLTPTPSPDQTLAAAESGESGRESEVQSNETKDGAEAAAGGAQVSEV